MKIPGKRTEKAKMVIGGGQAITMIERKLWSINSILE
jgi:hypothetical protein